jgi:hypothetical protein
MDFMDYIKACRRGSRELEQENSCGFVSTNKVHVSKKKYKRKAKHKKSLHITNN